MQKSKIAMTHVFGFVLLSLFSILKVEHLKSHQLKVHNIWRFAFRLHQRRRKLSLSLMKSEGETSDFLNQFWQNSKLLFSWRFHWGRQYCLTRSASCLTTMIGREDGRFTLACPSHQSNGMKPDHDTPIGHVEWLEGPWPVICQDTAQVSLIPMSGIARGGGGGSDLCLMKIGALEAPSGFKPHCAQHDQVRESSECAVGCWKIKNNRG